MIGTRTACLRSLGCALLFGLALPAMALQDSGNAGQEQAGGDQAEARTLDAVTVTGTRIKRTEVAAALPIMVLQKERSEEHTSELQSLMRISYAVFCLKKKNQINQQIVNTPTVSRQQTR